MRIHQVECAVRTTGALEFVDLTEDVERAVAASGVAEGRAVIYSPHPGCRLVVNERETGLLLDLKNAMGRMSESSPPGGAFIGSSSLMFPLTASRLRLGAWQRVLLVELEAGRDRHVVVQVTGEQP